ncbi:hypothetical protein S83_019245 [Arachis hypogaea]
MGCNNIGIVVNPVRLANHGDFGSPEFVADKLLQLQKDQGMEKTKQKRERGSKGEIKRWDEEKEREEDERGAAAVSLLLRRGKNENTSREKGVVAIGARGCFCRRSATLTLLPSPQLQAWRLEARQLEKE